MYITNVIRNSINSRKVGIGARLTTTRNQRKATQRWFVPLIAGAALSLGLVAPALATGGGPPIGPIYDCYGFSGPVMNYVTALQLKNKTTYLLAPFRKGNSLSGKVVKGTYKLRGKKIIFLTGAYGQIHWYGVWTLKTLLNGIGDARHIGLFTPKGQEPIECYPWPH